MAVPPDTVTGPRDRGQAGESPGSDDERSPARSADCKGDLDVKRRRRIQVTDPVNTALFPDLRSLRQLAAVNLRLPSGGHVDARFDDQLAAMVAARDEGLIAGVGLSNLSLHQLQHAATGTDIVCV